MLTRGTILARITSNRSSSFGPRSRQQTPAFFRTYCFSRLEITAKAAGGRFLRNLLAVRALKSACATAAAEEGTGAVISGAVSSPSGPRFGSGSSSSRSSSSSSINRSSNSSSSSNSSISKPRSAGRSSSFQACSGSASGSIGPEHDPQELRRIFEAEVSETGASSAIAPGADLDLDLDLEAETSGGKMDPQHRQTVEVVEVDVIEGENGEPGSSLVGTVTGSAAGAALAGGLAAAAALSAPLAVAVAAMGALAGAVAGGAVGKEMPRGVDVHRAMEFDQPAVVREGQEADEQEALAETVWDSTTAPPPASPLAGSHGGGGAAATARVDASESFHGWPTLGEHEIADVKPERQS